MDLTLSGLSWEICLAYLDDHHLHKRLGRTPIKTTAGALLDQNSGTKTQPRGMQDWTQRGIFPQTCGIRGRNRFRSSSVKSYSGSTDTLAGDRSEEFSGINKLLLEVRKTVCEDSGPPSPVFA